MCLILKKSLPKLLPTQKLLKVKNLQVRNEGRYFRNLTVFAFFPFPFNFAASLLYRYDLHVRHFLPRLYFAYCDELYFYDKFIITFHEVLKLKKTSLAEQEVVTWKIDVVWISSCSQFQNDTFQFKEDRDTRPNHHQTLPFFPHSSVAWLSKACVSVFEQISIVWNELQSIQQYGYV